MKQLSNLDLNQNQVINPRAHQVAGNPSTPVTGQWWYDTSTNLMKWQNNAGVIDPLARANHSGTQTASTISDFSTAATALRLDQFAAPTAAVSFNSQRITGVATPTAATDAANKGYVDDAVAGLSWKEEVRVATTAAGTLATSFANGQTVDAITLTTGDRILIKNQAAGAENGIYTVNASGAPTRATDSDTAAEVVGTAVFVSFGTTNAGTRWVLSTSGAITLGTTALAFAAFGGGATYTAGNGLTLSTNDFNVGAGTGISVAADTVGIDTAVTARWVTGLIGDGSTTSIGFTHSLGNQHVIAQATEVATGAVVGCDIVKTSTTVTTFTFTTAPAANSIRVNVVG
jgi:hypothetical protein